MRGVCRVYYKYVQVEHWSCYWIRTVSMKWLPRKPRVLGFGIREAYGALLSVRIRMGGFDHIDRHLQVQRTCSLYEYTALLHGYMMTASAYSTCIDILSTSLLNHIYAELALLSIAYAWYLSGTTQSYIHRHLYDLATLQLVHRAEFVLCTV